MSTTVGTLTIEMAANIVRLQQDMEKARKSVEGTMAQIGKAASVATAALGALGAGLSVAAFANWIKSAINAADVMSDISQRTGVAVKDLAGLQLAFKYGGTSAEAMQSGMVKLSVAVAGGSDALKAMGIQTKNTDGTLKGTRQILGEVADRFAEYEDGAAKTALAVQIFGKSGAELLPVLNAGSKGLDEFDAMARKLGLTIDAETAEQAGRFNDLLDLMGDSFSGIATQVGAKILPTLVQLADTFFTTMTEGDRLTRIADALAFGLKALYSVAVVVIEAFVSVGKTLGAVGGQIMAVMQGDFAGAARIGNEWAADVKKDWVGALQNLEGVWSNTGKTSVDTMLDMAGAAKKNAPIVNEETKKMADEQRKLQEAYQKLIDGIEEKTGVLLAEQGQTEKLTDAQKTALKVMQDIQNGTLKLTDAQKQQVTAALEQLLATEQVNEEIKRENKLMEEAAKENANWRESMAKTTQQLIDEAEKQREANIEIEQGKEAVERLRIAKLLETAASLERKAALAEEAWLGEDVVQAYRDQAQGLRDLAALKEQGIHVQAARDARDAWVETSKQITESLTDALMRGFESGKGFGENLISTLKNMFNTLVLRPIIQPIAQGMAGSVLGMLGIGAPGTASASTGGGMGTLNVMSGLQSVYKGITGSFAALGDSISFAAQDIGAWLVNNTSGVLNSAGSSLMSGAGTLGTLGSYAGGALAGFGIGNAISGKYETFGNGNIATAGGTAIGALLGGPVGALIGGALGGLVNRAFGRGPKESQDMGITGTFSTGGANVQGFTDWLREGGWFRSDKRGTDFTTLSTDINAFLDGAVKMVAASTKDYAKIVGLNADALDGFSQQIRISLKDLDAAGQEKAIADAIQTFQDGLTARLAGALEPFRMAGESLTQTLTRLAEIQIVSQSLNEFGGAFTNFATASVTARQSIIDLAGGIEQLVQKAQGFVANFYTREEQAAITARGVVTALAQSGFTEAQIAALETRADFRALLESIDVNTELGQQQFVTLLNLQQQYADLAPLMEEQQLTLLELIEAAPQVEILQKMFETDSAYQARVQGAEELAQATFESMAASLGEINVSIDGLSSIIGNGLGEIASSVGGAIAAANSAAQQAIAAAQSSAAAATQAASAATSAAYVVSQKSTIDVADRADFAAGGYYQGGMALVGEHGPELINFGAPGQVYTAPATANMLGGGDVAAEIRALRDEVTLMRSETRATAVNTSKIARLQDNWDVRGLTVKTDTDQPLNTVAA